MTNTSALLPTGSTTAWLKLRAHFEHHLNHIGPLPCGRCGQPITATDPWDLGHPDHEARALGGTDVNVWPEHPTRIPGICDGNRNAGGRLGNQRRRTAAHTELTPSRDW